jgi:hypothetical protein
MGGVRRAVVKIYHGRNVDHRSDMWRTPQEEGDKGVRAAAFTAAAVT